MGDNDNDLVLAAIALFGLAAVAFAMYYIVNLVSPPPTKEKDEGSSAHSAAGTGGRNRRGLGRANRRRKRGGAEGEGSSTVVEGTNDTTEHGDDGEDMLDDYGSGDDGNDDDVMSEGMTRRQIQKQMRKKEKSDLKKANQVARDDKAAKEGKRSEKYRKKEEERARKEQEAQEAALKHAALRKQKEQEDFDQWKDMFDVEGEGVGVAEQEEERQDVLVTFLNHVKNEKLVVLEDLAALFGLPTTEVIERLNALEKMRRISGVIDDRGKFIHVTTEEMNQIVAFMQRRGRVSIGTLAKESNKLVNMDPTKPSPEDSVADMTVELSLNDDDVKIVTVGQARKR